MSNHAEREDAYYFDESGERFRQLIAAAESKRSKMVEDRKNRIWWTLVGLTFGLICLTGYIAARGVHWH